MTDFTDDDAFKKALADNAAYSEFYKEHRERFRTFVSYYESCKRTAVAVQQPRFTEICCECFRPLLPAAVDEERIKAALLHYFRDSNYPEVQAGGALSAIQPYLSAPESEASGHNIIGIDSAIQAHENIIKNHSIMPRDWHEGVIAGLHEAKRIHCSESSPEPVSGWQPIETAPKGKGVLVFYKNRNGKGRVVKAAYIEKHTLEADSECGGDWGEYSEAHDEYFCPEGWYESIDNWDDFSEIRINEGEPSHWHPLPESPIEQESE